MCMYMRPVYRLEEVEAETEGEEEAIRPTIQAVDMQAPSCLVPNVLLI